MMVAVFVAPFLLPATVRFVATAAQLPGVRLAASSPPAARAGAARARAAPRRALAGGRRARPAADRRRRAWPGAAARAGRAAGRRAGAAAGAAGRGAGGARHPRHGRRHGAQRARQGADEDGAARRRGPVRPRTGWSTRRTTRSRSPTRSASRSSPSRLPGPARRRPTGSTTPTPCGAGSPPCRRGPTAPGAAGGVPRRREHTFDSVQVGRDDGLGLGLGLPAPAAGGAAQPVDPVDGAAAARARRPALRRDPGGRTGRRAALGRARRVDAHGVVPAPGRHGGGVRGRRPAAGRPALVDAGLRARRRLLHSCGAELVLLDRFDPPERKYAAGCVYLRGQGRGQVRAVHGVDELQRRLGHLVVEARLPEPGQPASSDYRARAT